MNRAEEIRKRASERGRKAQAGLRARIEREIDPDHTLPDDERTRLVNAAVAAENSERAKRGWQNRRAKEEKMAQPPTPSERQAPVTVASERRAGDQPNARHPIDPATWEPPEMRAALAAHDIAEVYRGLRRVGVSQRQISVLTGQSQSEVSEILSGRQVMAYDVLARIADGLGIPRGYMGLAYADGDGAYPGDVTVADPNEGDEVLRRQFEKLLALGAAYAFGAPVPGIGDLAELPTPPLPADLPSRIGESDLAILQSCRERLGVLARSTGGHAEMSARFAEWADQWLSADASDVVRRELLSVLSELHTVAAWCCHDAGAVARSHHHFGRAVELATDAQDPYRVAYALRHAGMMLIDRGQPDRALKLIQLAGLRLAEVPDDARVSRLQAERHVVSALALSRLDDSGSFHRQAQSELRQARDGQLPTERARACMDMDSALVWIELGQLDSAEAAAKLSVQTFAQGNDRREGVVADVTLARLHVRAGEPRGLTLAEHAIRGVSETRSGLAREWLTLLAVDLEARPGREAGELARMARGVAA